MNVNELKIRDRIKYKIPCAAHMIEPPVEGTATIMALDDEYVTVNYMNHKFYKKYITHKLEPQICNKCQNRYHPIKYKEIPIEKEKEKEEKSKSFKFDMEFVNRLEFNQNPIKPDYFPEAFFRIDGARIINYPSKDLESLNGKMVTIEIKVKE